MKTKAKKDKKPVEEGFELWNELEVQRIKFMVSRPLRAVLEGLHLVWIGFCWPIVSLEPNFDGVLILKYNVSSPMESTLEPNDSRN